MRKTTFILSCIGVLMLSACKRNYEKLHFAESYERFKGGYDYDERIENAQTFFQEFAASFNKAIKDSFPGFNQQDDLATGDLYKAKLTLYLSNTREELLLITKEGAPELRVEVSDFPVQYALGHNYDFVYSNTGIDPAALDFVKLLKAYDQQPGLTAIASDTHHYYFNDSLESSNRFIELGKQSMAILNNVLLQGNNAGRIVQFSMSDLGFLTVINGFSHWKDSATSLGKALAIAEVKKYCLSSPLFAQALSHPALSSLASEMLVKEKNIGPDGNSQYTCQEFQADNKKLIQAARASSENTELADHLEKFQQQKAKTFLLAVPEFPDRGDFMMRWIALNLLGLAALIFVGYSFKIHRFLHKKGGVLLLILLLTMYCSPFNF